MLYRAVPALGIAFAAPSESADFDVSTTAQPGQLTGKKAAGARVCCDISSMGRQASPGPYQRCTVAHT